MIKSSVEGGMVGDGEAKEKNFSSQKRGGGGQLLQVAGGDGYHIYVM